MRRSLCLAIGGLALTAGAALAEPAKSTAELAVNTTAIPREVPQTVRVPFTHAVALVLADQALETQDAAEKNWLSELQGHYRMHDAKPLWVDGTKLTPAGRALAAEILRADDYGLDPAQFTLPDQTANGPEAAARAEALLSFAAAKYIAHARGARVDPSTLSLWLDQRPAVTYASTELRRLAAAADPSAALLEVHPQHPEFEALRQAYIAERGEAPPPAVQLPATGPRLVRGDRHPDIVLLRARLSLPAETADKADQFDGELFDAVRRYASEQGLGRKRALDDDVRRVLNRPAARGAESRRERLAKFRVNLERWRLVPHDMGDLHVWNNLPEFLTRVVRDGTVIHEERIVIGKESTQTPVFSARMKHVIFQPDWGVPESIKLRQILPHFRGGDYGVLERRNMRIWDGERQISPRKFNWSKTNIAHVPIVQGPGPGNPLGRLKFIFPNGHDVYMHDTPDKHLFNSSERTFSHGCIRVRDPARLAEVILGETYGWTATDVKTNLSYKTTRKIDLEKPLAVHNTYFTMVVRADGTVSDFKDIYGHDRRMREALAGRPAAQIAASDPAAALARANKQLRLAGGVIAAPAKRVAQARKPVRLLPPMALGGYPPPPPGFKYKKPGYYKGVPPPSFRLNIF